MNTNLQPPVKTTSVLARQDIGLLLSVLTQNGYECIAPTKKDGAIVYDAISTDRELPIGWTDRQDAGVYRLEQRNDAALFGYAVGPHSWKKYLHPPERVLWRATRSDQGMQIKNDSPDKTLRAFIGVRACEIAAMEIQSRVFLTGPYKDEDYQRRRDHALIVGVNCSTPSATCFCASMNTGPGITSGYDILLTELITPDRHDFLIKTASAQGRAIIDQLPTRKALAADLKAAETVTKNAAKTIRRAMDTDGLKETLQNSPNHPQWDAIASRCLSCTNCTAVCPTCFCTTVEDHTDLTGAEATRVQKQDSCFSGAFSELGNGPVRQTTKSRYRQWMTHKLSTWFDQFDSSGCVGCGRCIAWCPVGIDITAEARAISTDREAG